MLHVAYHVRHMNLPSVTVRDGVFSFHVPKTADDIQALKCLLQADIKRQEPLSREDGEPQVTIITWNLLA